MEINYQLRTRLNSEHDEHECVKKILDSSKIQAVHTPLLTPQSSYHLYLETASYKYSVARFILRLELYPIPWTGLVRATMISRMLEALLWGQFSYNAALFASFTVVVFDHILTFSDEINYIWRRRLTPFSLTFLINRYFVLAMMSRLFHLVVRPTGPEYTYNCVLCGPEICFALLTIISTLLVEGILILRVYAVYNFSRPILGLLVSTWVLHLALITCAFLAVGNLPYPIETQVVNLDAAGTLSKTIPKINKLAGILLISPAILFDTIVGVLLTVVLYERSRSYQTKMPLVQLIIRDGLLYFMVVFLTNVCWILVHSITANAGHGFSDFFTFIPLEILSACITTTMIGRLTLNLRMYDPAANELTFQTMTMMFHVSHRDSSVDIHTDGVNEGRNDIDEEVL